MKIIKANSLKYGPQDVLVDDQDFIDLSRYKWSVMSRHGIFYATRNGVLGGRRVHILMAREILGLGFGDLRQADHIDGNGLNNRRSNLRIVSQHQNLMNSRKKSLGSSRFKGVTRAGSSWRARIRGKNLGCYDTEIAAAEAYDSEALALFGEYASLNFKK